MCPFRGQAVSQHSAVGRCHTVSWIADPCEWAMSMVPLSTGESDLRTMSLLTRKRLSKSWHVSPHALCPALFGGERLGEDFPMYKATDALMCLCLEGGSIQFKELCFSLRNFTCGEATHTHTSTLIKTHHYPQHPL